MPRVEKGTPTVRLFQLLGTWEKQLPMSSSVCGDRALTGGWQDLLGTCAHVCMRACTCMCICMHHHTHHGE